MEPIKQRFFSVELKSKGYLKNVTLNNGCGDYENVLVEGTIGQLQKAVFADCVVLEVFGDKGVLRINLTPDEIKKPKLPLNSTNKTNGGEKE